MMPKTLRLMAMVYAIVSMNNLLLEASGTTALQIHSMESNPRASALGGAVTAMPGAISGLNVNPAAIANLAYREGLFTQSLMPNSVKHYYAAYAHPTPWGATAVDFTTLRPGEYERYDRSGNNTGAQSPHETAAGFALSAPMKIIHLPQLNLGGAVRYIQSDLADVETSAVSFNLGAIYQLPIKTLSAGLAVNHLGPPMQYAAESSPQPRTYRLGLHYTTEPILNNSLQGQMTLDGIMPRAGGAHPAAGLELTAYRLLSFQLGYTGDDALEDRFRYGISVGRETLALQYAATPTGELGTAHTFSIHMRFNGEVTNFARNLINGRKNEKPRDEALKPVLISTIPAVEAVPPPPIPVKQIQPPPAKPRPKIETTRPKEPIIVKPVLSAAEIKAQDTAYKEAVAHINSRRLDEAIDLLKNLHAKEYPNAAAKLSDALKMRGIRNFSDRNYGPSVADFEEAYKLNPQDASLKNFADRARELLQKR